MILEVFFISGNRKEKAAMALRVNRNRLREIRREKGLSAVDINVLTGIPFSRLYYFERGTKTPTTCEKTSIAKALGCSLEKLFPEELEHSQEIVAEEMERNYGAYGAPCS
jgi:transcriptional regulator with XRE-family HTH domain